MTPILITVSGYAMLKVTGESLNRGGLIYDCSFAPSDSVCKLEFEGWCKIVRLLRCIILVHVNV